MTNKLLSVTLIKIKENSMALKQSKLAQKRARKNARRKNKTYQPKKFIKINENVPENAPDDTVVLL